jgi:hypothetical protein
VAAALLGAPVLWFAFQQAAGGVVYADCRLAAPPWGLAAGLAVTAVSAALAWHALRTTRSPQATPAQKFLATVGYGAAGVFVLGALAVTAALALVPACG